MSNREATKLLKSQSEVIALDVKAYFVLLSVSLSLLHNGVYPIAKITKGF